MWVVSLEGENVFQGKTNVAVIDSLESMPVIRKFIEKKYKCVFQETASRDFGGLKVYTLSLDDRDIVLVVENVYSLGEVEALLK